MMNVEELLSEVEAAIAKVEAGHDYYLDSIFAVKFGN